MSSKSGFKTSTVVTCVTCGFATCTVKKQNTNKTTNLVRPNVAPDGGGVGWGVDFFPTFKDGTEVENASENETKDQIFPKTACI